MKPIYDAPAFRLEGQVIESGKHTTLELYQTYPLANHPYRHRVAQFTLNTSGFLNLASLAHCAAMKGGIK